MKLLNLFRASNSPAITIDEIQLVNRSALFVQPQEHYLKWAAHVSGESLTKIRHDLGSISPKVFLIAESESLPEESTLKELAPLIFESMLDDWWHERETWPQDRSYAIFKNWFTITHSSEAFDLCTTKLKRDPIDNYGV